MLGRLMEKTRSLSDLAQVAVIVLVTVLTVVAVSLALRLQHRGDAGDSDPLTIPRDRNVVLLGGSFSAGAGASQEDRGFAARLAQATGWRVVNLARAGTGYAAAVDQDGFRTCGQERCRSFVGMLDRATSLRPDADVVMVFGGRADVMSSALDEERAVRTFFSRLRDAYPGAEIIAVSPVWDVREPPPELDAIAGDVQREVRAVRGTYLDVGQPLRGRPDLMDSEGTNPDDAGHAALASAVVRELRAAGVV